MSVSVVLTINNRTEEVCRKVMESFRLPGNTPDEMVVVLDRPTEEARKASTAYTELDCNVRFVEIEGEPGWLGPARAWNHGFNAASGDLLYCISSEVVQVERNVQRAAMMASDGDAVIFGACHNSIARDLVVGAEPGLLVSSKMPRPLGFIVCMPRKAVMEIGGFDEGFMNGFWYDDDDFFLRLWNTGLDFIFEDTIHGVHLDHERPDLETKEGQEKIARNMGLMQKKHGTTNPWQALSKTEYKKPGRTVWMHG